jgi:hypothetical protein
MNHYEEGLYKVHEEKARVIWSIDNLYGTLSNMAHLKVEESFPIKVTTKATRWHCCHSYKRTLSLSLF